MLHHLPHAAHFRGAGNGVVVDHAEAEVGVEERVHHDAVAELEDLQREDRPREEDEREREERQLHGVVLRLLGGRAAERVEIPAAAEQRGAEQNIAGGVTVRERSAWEEVWHWE